jgi:6-pyruvoyltetrahydropterin/6-carboxytetrahydropterin synthase
MEYNVSVVRGFSAAHALRGYKGKCEKLHGHNWKIKAVVSGKKLNKTGMLLDFTDLRAMIDSAAASLDHAYLNETKPFDKTNPTAENIAAYIHGRLSKALPAGLKVKEVEVWESDNSSATVTA